MRAMCGVQLKDRQISTDLMFIHRSDGYGKQYTLV